MKRLNKISQIDKTREIPPFLTPIWHFFTFLKKSYGNTVSFWKIFRDYSVIFNAKNKGRFKRSFRPIYRHSGTQNGKNAVKVVDFPKNALKTSFIFGVFIKVKNSHPISRVSGIRGSPESDPESNPGGPNRFEIRPENRFENRPENRSKIGSKIGSKTGRNRGRNPPGIRSQNRVENVEKVTKFDKKCTFLNFFRAEIIDFFL